MAQPLPPAFPVPPIISQAQAQLAAALEQAEGKPVDLLKAPWAEVEKGAIKLLGGAFQPDRPEHQMLALGVAGAFAARLSAEHQAFWFPNRDAPAGAMLGFPNAFIMLGPFDAVMGAFTQRNLAKLDELSAEIRRKLGEVRFNATGPLSLGGPPKLGPADYQQMFDPGILQFAAMDPAKIESTLKTRPDALARDLKDAAGRVQPPLPPEARQEIDQIIMALQRMDASKPLVEQLERGPQLAELMVYLTATVEETHYAPAEFWAGLFLPLLFIGVPQQFPPLDDEELDAYKQGADPLELFVDVVPHAHRSPEGGLLDAFDAKAVDRLHPNFQKVGPPRAFRINPEGIKPLLQQFDPAKTAEAVGRFAQYLAEQSGKPAEDPARGKELLQGAMMFLSELKKAVLTVQGPLCLRRLTANEAALEEQHLVRVRRAMQGGRIILTS